MFWAMLIGLVIGLMMSLSGSTFKSGLPEIPETIAVKRTGVGVCVDDMDWHWENIDFNYYVKGVLAAEWGWTWNPNSLKAGAVAVKTYAMNAIERRGYVWDCNWDQVFRPEWSKSEIDAAVDETWNWILVDADSLQTFPTYYDDYLETCIQRGESSRCAGQWDTKNDADSGMHWKSILTKYYSNAILINLKPVILIRDREYNLHQYGVRHD